MLGAYFLKEELGTLGKLGCAICLLGSVIIVLHAPPDENIENVGQILDYALRPGQTALPAQQYPSLLTMFRVHHLLSDSHRLLRRHDL